MKRFVSFMLCVSLLFSCCAFQTTAVSEDNFVPYVVDFSLTSPVCEFSNVTENARASGLILSYMLNISVTGTTLNIYAETYCASSVVKSGFKNMVVQRKLASSSSWSDYYDYGDLYEDSYAALLSTKLAVVSGYQYRITCKHYAKKSLLVTESISNVSNIVAA